MTEERASRGRGFPARDWRAQIKKSGAFAAGGMVGSRIAGWGCYGSRPYLRRWPLGVGTPTAQKRAAFP